MLQPCSNVLYRQPMTKDFRQKLADDIAWHQQQIRLISEALSAADRVDNPTREIEVEALSSSLTRFERTLAHLLELRVNRG